MRVAVDNVPTLVRPPEVEQVVQAAVEMRDRAREAAEAVAAAQRTVDELEREDVEAAAARARAGEPLGAPGAPLKKARDTLALRQRDLNALRLALEQSEQAVADAVTANADNWTQALTDDAEQAVELGRAAVAAMQEACRRIGDANGAKNWIAAAIADGRFDRPPSGVMLASYAPSSRSRTANGEPLHAAEVLDFARELIDPPTVPTTEPTLHVGEREAS